MARDSLDIALAEIDAELLLMASMVENAIVAAVEVVVSGDYERAQKIVDMDDLIDEKEFQIETRVLEAIRRETPLASDLRNVISASRISGELERIGDYAEGMARIAMRSKGKERLIAPPPEMHQMADTGILMLRSSLKIYAGDVAAESEEATRALVDEVASKDDEVDTLYEKALLRLTRLMADNTNAVEQATYMLWIVHNLERIADRSVNIAERAFFHLTGKQIAL